MNNWTLTTTASYQFLPELLQTAGFGLTQQDQSGQQNDCEQLVEVHCDLVSLEELRLRRRKNQNRLDPCGCGTEAELMVKLDNENDYIATRLYCLLGDPVAR